MKFRDYEQEYLSDGEPKYHIWCFFCDEICDDIVYLLRVCDSNRHMFFCSEHCRRTYLEIDKILYDIGNKK